MTPTVKKMSTQDTDLRSLNRPSEHQQDSVGCVLKGSRRLNIWLLRHHYYVSLPRSDLRGKLGTVAQQVGLLGV